MRAISRHRLERAQGPALVVVGAALGPIVGGALLERFWWGSVFLINVPIVLVVIAINAKVVPRQPARREQPLNLLQALVLIAAILMLVFSAKSALKGQLALWLTALVALGGSLFAQTNGFADVTSGVGTIVVGLAAVIIGGTNIVGGEGKLSGTLLGVLFIVISFAVIVWALIAHFNGHTLPGWTSLLVSVWFVGGAILLALGIIGEYIGKIYSEVKRRPRYIVESFTGDME